MSDRSDMRTLAQGIDAGWQIPADVLVELPADVQPALDALQPQGIARRAMNTLLTLALRPDHPSCTVPGYGVAAFLLYVRSHWLRMPWYQILPHLARKSWKRFQARREGAAERARQQAAEAAGGAVPLPEER